MVVFGISLTLLLVLLGIVIKKNRLLTLIMFIWQFILIGFNYENIDTSGYMDMFRDYGAANQVKFSLLDGGLYRIWIYFSVKLGLDFVATHAILSFICLIVLYKAITKYTQNVNFVYSLMFIFPLVDMVIQKRNLYAMVFVLYGLHYLNEKKLSSTLKYVFCCLIAFGFHESSALYLIFVIVPYLNWKSIMKYVIVFDVILLFTFPKLISISSKVFSMSKIELYFQQESFRLAIWKVAVFMILHCLFVYFMYLFEKRSFLSVEVSKNNEIIFKIAMFSLFLLPFYYYNSTFFRFLRNLLIVFYAVIANYQATGKIHYKSIFKYTGSMFLFLIFLFFFFYVFTGDFGFDILVNPIFEKNTILNLFRLSEV